MKEAAAYIRKCLKMGIAEDIINQQLREAGWDEQTITKAWQKARRPWFSGITDIFFGLNKVVLVIFSAIIILLIGGYLSYANFFASSPGRIWGQVYENTAKATSWKSLGEISYTDKSASGVQLTLTASHAGQYRAVLADDLPDFNLNSQAKIKGGGLDVGISVESRKVGNALYYKLDGIPLLSLFMGSDLASGTDKPKWFKIDLDKKMEGQFSALEFIQTFQKNLKEFQKPFWQLKLLKPVKRVGDEKIDTISTWHYWAEINDKELENYVNTLILALGSEKLLEETNKDISETLRILLDKLDFKKVEMWIGKKDKRVYQILIETNAPSLVKADLAKTQPADTKKFQQFIESLPFEANLTIRTQFSNFDKPVRIDAPQEWVDYFEHLEKANKSALNEKALADVRHIVTALALYHNDNNRYPDRLGHLNTTGGGKVDYIGILPKPLGDPMCEGVNEFYNYTANTGGKSYIFDFCLTADIENLPAGRHQASDQGIR